MEGSNLSAHRGLKKCDTFVLSCDSSYVFSFVDSFVL